MVFLGKNLNMNIVASIGYCIEVVGKEGQGEQESIVVQHISEVHRSTGVPRSTAVHHSTAVRSCVCIMLLICYQYLDY